MAVRNPVAELVDRMGLTTDSVARVAGITVKQAEAALSTDPLNPLGHYLSIQNAIGATVGIRVNRGLCFSVDVNSVDALRTRDGFRRTLGLDLNVPRTRGELRRTVRAMRRREMTYGEIVAWMERNWVPTAAGLRDWRRSTVGQYMAGKLHLRDDADQVVPGPVMARAFRRFAMDALALEMFDADPVGLLRWNVRRGRTRDGRVFLVGDVMPDCLIAWAVRRVTELGWFTPDEWRVDDAPPDGVDYGDDDEDDAADGIPGAGDPDVRPAGGDRRRDGGRERGEEGGPADERPEGEAGS